MSNRTNVIIKNVDIKKAKSFIKNTSSAFLMKKNDKSVIADYSWVDYIDECLPYLESVIQNPRRFLISEEEILPVEKTKRVSRESIKHLSQHTSLIQEVDEDGFVHPEKLLNVYREETFDIYENRFLYTVVLRLYDFLESQMDATIKSYRSSKKTITYKGDTKYENENITIDLKINSNYKEEINTAKNISNISDRKLYIFELVENIYNGPFMKIMAQASTVRNPIRRTNAILKDQNFRKVLELWEYLDKIEDTELVKNEDKTEEITNNKIKNKYDFTYFINYYFANNFKEQDDDVSERSIIEKIIEDYIYDNNIDPNYFKKRVNLILRKITQRKEKNIKNIEKLFNNFIKEENFKIKKATAIINIKQGSKL